MKDFENSLDKMLEKAFLTISSGVDDAKSYFHTPTVCTFEGLQKYIQLGYESNF